MAQPGPVRRTPCGALGSGVNGLAERPGIDPRSSMTSSGAASCRPASRRSTSAAPRCWRRLAERAVSPSIGSADRASRPCTSPPPVWSPVTTTWSWRAVSSRCRRTPMGSSAAGGGNPVPAGVPRPLQPDPQSGHRRGDDRRQWGFAVPSLDEFSLCSHEKAAAAHGSGRVRRPDRRRHGSGRQRGASRTRASAAAAPSRDWVSSSRPSGKVV